MKITKKESPTTESTNPVSIGTLPQIFQQQLFSATSCIKTQNAAFKL